MDPEVKFATIAVGVKPHSVKILNTANVFGSCKRQM